MKEQNRNSNDRMLTITQVARACGVSRTTLRRLAEEELLLPANGAESGEKRLYTLQELVRLQRILELQRCGLTHKEIKSSLALQGDYSTVLEKLRSRRRFLSELINEIQFYAAPSSRPEVIETYGGDAFFFMRTQTSQRHYSGAVGFVQETVFEAVKRGLELDYSGGIWLESPAFLREEQGILSNQQEEIRYTALIKIHLPKSEAQKRQVQEISPYDVQQKDREKCPGQVVLMHRARALSIIVSGYEEPVRPAYEWLKREAMNRGFRPIGPVYYSAIISSDFEKIEGLSNNLLRVLVPLERTEDPA